MNRFTPGVKKHGSEQSMKFLLNSHPMAGTITVDEESLADHEDMGIFATFCRVSKKQHVSCETMEMSSVSLKLFLRMLEKRLFDDVTRKADVE